MAEERRLRRRAVLARSVVGSAAGAVAWSRPVVERVSVIPDYASAQSRQFGSCRAVDPDASCGSASFAGAPLTIQQGTTFIPDSNSFNWMIRFAQATTFRLTITVSCCETGPEVIERSFDSFGEGPRLVTINHSLPRLASLLGSSCDRLDTASLRVYFSGRGGTTTVGAAVIDFEVPLAPTGPFPQRIPGRIRTEDCVVAPI